MKKNVLLVLVITLVVGAIILCLPYGEKKEELIRIHIRANSNGASDQSVKYQIRDAAVGYLTPLLEGAGTRDNAYAIIEQHSAALKSLSDSILKQQGFAYRAEIKLLNEYFPVRQYEDITVESGFYDALIIELGSAQGDNWWCVVYPPLCFVSAEGNGKVVYKSKLLEMLRR